MRGGIQFFALNDLSPFFSPRIRWLTALAVAAVLAVNAAAIWSIAVARRAAREHAGQVLRLETSARAREIESILARTRADLVFLSGSAAFSSLETALGSSDPREARWRRLWAEGSALLFLRGHPEVRHLSVRSRRGAGLVQAGRRGGIPVLWRHSGPGSRAPRAGPVHLEVIPEAGRAAFGALLLAELDPPVLFTPQSSSRDRACQLRDGSGAALAGRVLPGATGWMTAHTAVQVEGWSRDPPWTLTCRERPGASLALLEPLAARYRRTTLLNLVVMALSVLLGLFAIQQTRRFEQLSARAREKQRVHDVELQLFHAERLTTAGRLAAGMAHEINNPLEGMSNYLSLARDALGRGATEAASVHVDRVREGLDRAAGVVRQVLAHADPATAPSTPVDLNEVLLNALEFVRTRDQFSGVEFAHDTDHRPLEVRGNATMLGQLFLNLLLNACEAQPGRGEVLVRTRVDGDTAQVEIADRGPGVPAEARDRVFEPFYSTKQSTGLGLSVCWSIVGQHGGDLSLDDRPGGGTLFRVRLPLNRGQVI